MNVHFIAIGGSAMHNLAIALHLKGYRVTGSDDEICEITVWSGQINNRSGQIYKTSGQINKNVDKS